MTSRTLWWSILPCLTALACAPTSPPEAGACAAGTIATAGDRTVCVQTIPNAVCQSGETAATLGGYTLCADGSLDDEAVRAALDTACGANASPSWSDGVGACVFASSKGDGHCPAHTPHAYTYEQLGICASSEGLGQDALQALFAQACEGGTSVTTEAGAGCVFITETGFSCPTFVTQSQAVADWTVCGPAGLDTAAAQAMAEASCTSEGTYALADGASGCIFITETGFNCPPHLVDSQALGDWKVCGGSALSQDAAAALATATCQTEAPGVIAAQFAVSEAGHGGCVYGITETGFNCPPHAAGQVAFGDTVICGRTGLSEDAAIGTASAHCGPGGQFVQTVSAGHCVFSITETGFTPCPTTHPERRAAQPFDTCSVTAHPPARIAQARRNVCGPGAASAGFLDQGNASMCAFITETGFDCPPLLSEGLTSGAATVCKGPGQLPEQAVNQAALFAATPSVCPWADGLTDNLDQTFGGIRASVQGFVMAGVVQDFGTVSFPGNAELDVEAGTSAHFLARFNLNGSVSDISVVATTPGTLIACDLAVLNDGSIILAGISDSLVAFAAGGETGTVDASGDKLYLARLDPYGTLQAAHAVPIPPWGAQLYTCGISANDDGTVSAIVRDLISETGSALIKVDAAGQTLWQQQVSHQFGAATLHPDGSQTVVGAFEGTLSLELADGNAVQMTATERDGFVARLNADGDAIWVRHLRGYDEDRLWGVTGDGADGVVVAGQATGNIEVVDPVSATTVETLSGVDDGLWDALIARFDSAGNVVWSTRADGVFSSAHELSIGLDGQLHLGGRYLQDMQLGGLSLATSPTDTFENGFVARLELSSGAVTTLTSTSGEANMQPYGFVVGHLDGSTTQAGEFAVDGDYGVPGYTTSLVNGEAGLGIFMVHTGNDTADCTIVEPLEATR